MSTIKFVITFVAVLAVLILTAKVSNRNGYIKGCEDVYADALKESHEEAMDESIINKVCQYMYNKK